MSFVIIHSYPDPRQPSYELADFKRGTQEEAYSALVDTFYTYIWDNSIYERDDDPSYMDFCEFFFDESGMGNEPFEGYFLPNEGKRTTLNAEKAFLDAVDRYQRELEKEYDSVSTCETTAP